MQFQCFKKLIGVGLCLLMAAVLTATTVPKKLDLILLIGQSNMAGRGKVDAISAPENEKIWVMNAQNEWIMARDPLHFDKPGIAGVGPGLAFAQRWLELSPKTTLGLIPCAVGGSGIDDWQPGAKHAQTGIYPYDAMLQRVREAQKQGRIRAILWHQGESDSSVEKSKVYEAKLTDFFARLRKDIGASNTPIIMGTLGDFFVNKNPNGQAINAIIASYPQTHRHVYAVSSEGLAHKGDTTHFDTASARELGRRYANKLWEVKN
ncbi:MAG: sialate O-acetylesterase [Bacteroidetes bacterium]|nr:sialate O-acetylesterase [Bacteroidota bacterium]